VSPLLSDMRPTIQIFQIFLVAIISTEVVVVGSSDNGGNAIHDVPHHAAEFVQNTVPKSYNFDDASSELSVPKISIAERKRRQQLDAVSFVATGNILNSFRFANRNLLLLLLLLLFMQMRMPRLCWEACIRVVAQSAKTVPSSMILLSVMLASTALIDIFIWGPISGFFTTFEKCSGGGWFSGTPKICSTDYTKGFSGILVRPTERMFACIYR
jgi:hypothetical protein